MNTLFVLIIFICSMIHMMAFFINVIYFHQHLEHDTINSTTTIRSTSTSISYLRRLDGSVKSYKTIYHQQQELKQRQQQLLLLKKQKIERDWKSNFQQQQQQKQRLFVQMRDDIIPDDVKYEITLVERRFYDGIKRNLDLASKRERDAYHLFPSNNPTSSSTASTSPSTPSFKQKHSKLYILYQKSKENKELVKELIQSLRQTNVLNNRAIRTHYDTLKYLDSEEGKSALRNLEMIKKSQQYQVLSSSSPPQSQITNQQLGNQRIPPSSIHLPHYFYASNFVDESKRWYEKSSALFNIDPPVVSIRGTMSSGTNWLRSLLRKNCPAVPFNVNTKNLGTLAFDYSGTFPTKLEFDADALYGWKHGLLREAEMKMLRENPNHSIVIVVRNAVSWLSSMFRMANTGLLPRQVRAADMISLQKLRYQHQCPVDFPGNTLLRYYVAVSNFSSIVAYPGANLASLSACEEYSQEADNIVHARTRDYKNWLNAMKILPNQIKFVRYEDLKDNPYKVFSELVQSLPGEKGKSNFMDYCNFNETTFNPVPLYAKYGVIGNDAGRRMRMMSTQPNQNQQDVSFDAIKKMDEIELCEKFFSRSDGTDAYKYLLSNLDLDFERYVLGYNYPLSFPEGPCSSRTNVKYY